MRNESYAEGGELPPVSKPLVAIGIITILLIVSAFVPASWLGVKPSPKRAAFDFSTINREDVTTYDSNGDGSVSWGEVIKNSESESVIEEAKQAGAPSAQTIAALNDPNNLTASYSKNLYLTALQIKEAGGITGEEQNTILEELAKEEASKVVSKTYVYADIKVAKTEDKESVKAYGNQVAKILDTVITKEAVYNTVGSIEEFTTNKNQNNIQDMELVKKEGDRIAGIIQKMLDVSVPPSASLYHLLTLNQLELYKDNLINLSQTATDPIRAKIASDNYSAILMNTATIHTKLAEYFKNKPVVFSPNENGYVFIVGYTPR